MYKELFNLLYLCLAAIVFAAIYLVTEDKLRWRRKNRKGLEIIQFISGALAFIFLIIIVVIMIKGCF